MSRKPSQRARPAEVPGGGARAGPHLASTEALVELGASRTLADGDVEAFLREAAIVAGRVLDVTRVVVWRFDESHTDLRCELLYERDRERFSSGGTVPSGRHPGDGDAHQRVRLVETGRTAADPRTRDFAESYLIPNRITALMDTPIRVGGRVVGFICHEQVGRSRSWSEEQQHFAGSVADLVAFAIERAGRRAAEASLQQSMERYRSLVESVRDAIYTLDREGRIESLNRAFEQLLGLRRDEWIGQHFAPLIHPDDLGPAAELMARVLAGESPPSYELRIRNSEGEYRVGELRATPRWDGAEVVGVLGVARDVTERKRTEAANRALLDLAREIAGALDLDELLARVLEGTAQAVPADLVLVSREEGRNGLVRVIAHRGVPEAVLPAVLGLRFEPGSTFGGRVYGGETIVINEPPRDAAVAVGLETMGVTALLVAPLRFRGHSFGALVVGRRGGTGFSRSQVELCEAIARQVAGAIEVAELYRAKEEEAHVAAALARVGREMISSVDAPVLVERFCRVTREVLCSDITHTFLYDEATEEFAPIGGAGETAVPWSALQTVRVPYASVADLVARLEAEGLVRLSATDPLPPFLESLMHAYGIASGLVLALRRGREIVGVQTVGLREPGLGFTPAQERIARGVADIASLALDNARLFEQLESASRLKSDFVATISHELRTPLNVILGYAGLLIEGAFGPLAEPQTDAVRRLERSGKALFELVSATLDLSRLEAGRVSVEDEDFDAAALVREVIREAQEESERRGIAAVSSGDGEPLEIRTDRAKLKLVLVNLVSNALKFTERGSVELACSRRDDGVELRVTDTGPGIPPEQQTAVFEPFRQGDASPSRRYGGAGLGLYIVRRVLELLGGTVSLESEVGRGSTFRVWLPRRR